MHYFFFHYVKIFGSDNKFSIHLLNKLVFCLKLFSYLPRDGGYNLKILIMQTKLLPQPAMRFVPAETCEYLLVINPPNDVYNLVKEEKEHFYEAYKQRIAVKTLPHITAANFLAREQMEDTIIRYIHRVVGAKTEFPLLLNNFSGFAPHTVFIRVHQHRPFKQLAAELAMIDDYVRGNGLPAASLVSYPHLIIANKLPENVYRQAMMDYSQKLFHASFMVNEMVLLRRKSQYDACQKVNIFRLLPVEATRHDEEAIFIQEDRQNPYLTKARMH